jgi:hypothetical protein
MSDAEEAARRNAEETIARLEATQIFPPPPPGGGGAKEDANFEEGKDTRTKEEEEEEASSDDDDDNDDDDLEWDLGFLEEREEKTNALHAIYFPSKVGGDPQWLDPSVHPKQMHEANATKRRMDFLLQIYAANDDGGGQFERKRISQNDIRVHIRRWG